MTIVVGFNGSSHSWDALSWACGMSQRSEAHVIATFVGSLFVESLASVAGHGSDSGIVQQLQTEWAGRLQSDTERYADEDGFHMTFSYSRGDVAQELLRTARLHCADFIVVGKSTKFLRRSFGSLGSQLAGMRESPIVVVVP
jgi:nucleotide-binding universal stress UspA family protein